MRKEYKFVSKDSKLIDDLSRESGITKSAVKAVIKGYLDELRASIERGEEVAEHSIFYVDRKTTEATVKNIFGKETQIPRRETSRIKFSSALKRSATKDL